jgi:hypothetical protein
MPLVEAEEARVEALKEEQRQAMMDNMANPDVGPAPKTNGKNGQGVAGFTKAGSGADAETKRLAKGKPPISRVGRVAADKRPGAG